MPPAKSSRSAKAAPAPADAPASEAAPVTPTKAAKATKTTKATKATKATATKVPATQPADSKAVDPALAGRTADRGEAVPADSGSADPGATAEPAEPGTAGASPEPAPLNRAERRAQSRGKKPQLPTAGGHGPQAGRRNDIVVPRRSGRRGNR